MRSAAASDLLAGAVRIVMIETMACGTPVIAFRRGSVSEIVKDGVDRRTVRKRFE